MRALDRRVGALEQLRRRPSADRVELWRDVPRHLTFEEIELGQAALTPYGGDPLAALRAGDPTMVALVAVARARRAGVPTPPMSAVAAATEGAAGYLGFTRDCAPSR